MMKTVGFVTWEEFRKLTRWPQERWKQIPVECPKCGKSIYVRIDEILTCYINNIPVCEYRCDCGWKEQSNMRLPDSFFEKALDELFETMKGKEEGGGSI